MKLGSLFSGIGGFDLAAEAVGWEVAWQAEIDPACAFWLAEQFPGVPNLGDVSRVEWAQVERVDVLCGGFPCQPHSVAGKKQGASDERDLWPEIVRCVRHYRDSGQPIPVLVFENVPGLLTTDGGRFFAGVLGDLAALGYDVEWTHISAESVGAPHGRDRVWIVAYAAVRPWMTPTANEDALEHTSLQRRSEGRPESELRRDALARSRFLPVWDDAVAVRGADGTIRLIPRVAAEEAWAQSALRVMDDGILAVVAGFTPAEDTLWPVAPSQAGRVARLSAVGNALSPHIPRWIFQRINAWRGGLDA